LTVVRAREIARQVAALPRGASLHVSGTAGSMPALVARAIALADTRPIVCVAADQDAARAIADDLAFVWGTHASDVLLYAAHEAGPYADVNPDRRAAMSRLATLSHLAHERPLRFLVVPAAALVRKVVPKREIVRHTMQLVAGSTIERDALLARLAHAGYVRVPVVEDPGTLAVRGGILDVWPASSELPLRVDFDDDRVQSIRAFDPVAQRSVGDKDEPLWLPPAREAILTVEAVERARSVVRSVCDRIDLPSTRARALAEDVASGRSFFGAEGWLPAYYPLEPISRYFSEDALCLVVDPSGVTRAVKDELERAQRDADGDPKRPHLPTSDLYETEDHAAREIASLRALFLHRTRVEGSPGGAFLTRFEAVPPDAASLSADDQSALERTRSGKDKSLDPLMVRLVAWREEGMRVVVAARTDTQAERLATLVRHRDLPCEARVGRFDRSLLDAAPPGAPIVVVTGPLARGVIAPAEGLVLVTEEEIFGKKAHRAEPRAPVKTSQAFLQDLRALIVGNHVVHVEHGVGRYLGLIHKDIGAITVDLIIVEYAGSDKLYLPVYRLNQIQKWVGDGAPKLDRLGGQTFERTKTRVKKQVRKMADELLRLYAERRMATTEPLAPLDDDYRAFEATFPYEETPDQGRAIDDMLRDLGAGHPMDRLVCGDVGFGKTEVAIRAAFRIAVAGKQVAVLCPTTVLVQQHCLSFRSRIGTHPIRVEAMSRFQTKAEQAVTLRGLRDGTVDVVIGTHRLLSRDVHFRRLGLLVVDEEQRFGVVHKERIKQLKTNVHVLTLTATPIPRTLQMAVSGIRDMSLIATPPVDRRAVRTVVTRMDDAVIRDALRRELERGGQVFYVYNRIEHIHERASRIQDLVPEARVAVGHGQMSERALERTMLDFIGGRYDVLVSTAIVESGLDIPRANTILIDRADIFGLADLYQLRGRVGRASDRGYCYLIVPPASTMTEEARARIEAIERHTDLGAGFAIASLDLEQRGAGDLLGAEQSGSVAAVGFELFCAMLEEAVHELRGEVVVHEVEPDLSFDAEALLPEDYVADIGVRLSLYKRLASAASDDDVLDLAREMEDRFGSPPPEARRLMHLMRIKVELRSLRALGCEATSRRVTLHLRDDTPLDPALLTDLVTRKGSPYRLSPDMRITRLLRDEDGAKDGLAAVDTVLAELARLRKPS
jgi:transcription-repair coupling factor (superfamily II helicase)